MILLIDVGNTESVLGVADKTGLVARWRIATHAADTPDTLAVNVHTLFSIAQLDFSQVKGAVLAAVVPKIVATWKMALETFEIPVVLASEVASDTLVSRYGAPQEIGPDRLANAAGAVGYYGSPAIVIDYGTATNIDVIDVSGAYIGGVIAPGIGISSDALFSRAARLASIPLVDPGRVIGENTTEALQAGIIIGTAAQTEGLVERIKAELQIMNAADQSLDVDRIPVIATGGHAHLIAKQCSCFSAIDPDLTLKGLFIMGKDTFELL